MNNQALKIQKNKKPQLEILIKQATISRMGTQEMEALASKKAQELAEMIAKQQNSWHVNFWKF